VAAFFASDDWNFPPGLKQKWRRFLAQHEGSSADDVDAELWKIDAATPRM
jgi:hypothetical protein